MASLLDHMKSPSGSVDPTTGDILKSDGSGWQHLAIGTPGQALAANGQPEYRDVLHHFQWSMDGTLVTGDDLAWMANKFGRQLTFVSAYAVCKTAPTGTLTIDILSATQTNIDGTPSWASIFSTTLTVDANERSSKTAATAAVFGSGATLAVDAHLKMEVLSTTGGSDMSVILIVKETG